MYFVFVFVQLGVVWVGELGEGPVIWELFSYEQALLGMLRRHFGNLWRRSLENDTATFGKAENLGISKGIPSAKVVTYLCCTSLEDGAFCSTMCENT